MQTEDKEQNGWIVGAARRGSARLVSSCCIARADVDDDDKNEKDGDTAHRPLNTRIHCQTLLERRRYTR